MKKLQHISGVFIVLFLCGAGFCAVTGAAKAMSVTHSPTIETALNGRWAAAYEASFNKSVQIYEPSILTWGLLNYVLFEEGKEGVLIGDDGWLFTKEEFDYTPKRDEEINNKISYIKSVHDQLEASGVKMVVALIPAKARLYKDNLGRYRFPSYQENTYIRSRTELERNGIPVANIYSAMENSQDKEAFFLKTDTHWTPYGAEVAAKAVAAKVSQEWPELAFEKTLYKTISQDVIQHEGDLLNYIPLGAMREDIGLSPDRLVSVITTKIDGKAQAESHTEADALFGQVALPVTLVGTSYSANPHWNFDGYLKENLHTDVLNAADEGRGPFETMKDYLADGAFKESPPQLVIWEIPERYLPVSYDIAVY